MTRTAARAAVQAGQPPGWPQTSRLRRVNPPSDTAKAV